MDSKCVREIDITTSPSVYARLQLDANEPMLSAQPSQLRTVHPTTAENADHGLRLHKLTPAATCITGRPGRGVSEIFDRGEPLSAPDLRELANAQLAKRYDAAAGKPHAHSDEQVVATLLKQIYKKCCRRACRSRCSPSQIRSGESKFTRIWPDVATGTTASDG